MNARLPALTLTLLAIAWLAWAVAGWTRPWPGGAEPAPGGTTAADGSAESSGPVLPPAQDLSELAQLGLLGRAPPADPVAQEAAPVEAAVERVPLDLMGTLPGPSPEQGLAILSGPEGQASYRVGAELPGGARLTAVDARGVEIAFGEARERVELPVASTEPVEQRLLPATLGGGAAGKVSPAAKAAPLPGQGNVATARQRLEELRRQQQERRRSGGQAATGTATGRPASGAPATAVGPGVVPTAGMPAAGNPATPATPAARTANNASGAPAPAAQPAGGNTSSGSGFVQATPGSTGTRSARGFELGTTEHFEALRSEMAARPPTPSAYPLPPPGSGP